MIILTKGNTRLRFGSLGYLSIPKPDPKFIIRVDTTKTSIESSSSDTMIIPTDTNFTYNFTVNWGDGNSDSFNSSSLSSFQHTYTTGGEYIIEISGTFPKCFFNNGGDKLKLLEIMNWGNYGIGITSQVASFRGCENNIAISEDWDNIDNVLEVSTNMFSFNNLSSLPSSMKLSNLTNGFGMFRSNNLTSLPNTMTLSSLIYGNIMFSSNSITSISDNITLSNMIDGTSMFFNNTINTTDYSNLIIRMEANNPYNNVPFHGGDSKYNLSAQSAHDQLTTPVIDGGRGWTITDNGLEN